MSLLDASGKKISPEKDEFNVQSYKWVPENMVIMISSQGVIVMVDNKKWQMTHAKYEKFKRDLQEKWDGEATVSTKEQTFKGSKEGTEAPASKRQRSLH